MGLKNFGIGVSGYLEPDGRAWETVVQQAGKPLLDKELNLTSDLKDLPARDGLIRSGWMTDWDAPNNADFLSGTPAANSVLLQGFGAFVNGWLVLVDRTHASSDNLLNLGVGPAGAGARRTDIVVLEVWRRLLSASPDGTGKSPTARIWKDGNVKTFDLGDPNVDINNNLTDDILDGAVGSETTKRVQIQYRLRVIQGVDLLAYPQGINDPVVFANSVPAAPTFPDGVATTFNYTQDALDGTLWKAGDGNPSNTLGTVDGYMYAIPLCAVFRRNTTAFDKNLNHNGGVAFPGPSDRPDGLFHDIVTANDIADLRSTTFSTEGSWAPRQILDRNVDYLLDNVLCTEWMTTPRGGGIDGHTALWADEVGISMANGGDGVVTGDTPGGVLVGEFDAVRRAFSDRPIVEVASVRVACPGPAWVSGMTFLVSPSALEVYPYGPFNWAAYAPNEVTFIDIRNAYYQGNAFPLASADATLTLVEDLGTRPQVPVQVTVGAVPPGITNEDLFLDVVIAYPAGRGLSKTAVTYHGVTYNNPAQLPAIPPISFAADAISMDAPHREAQILYTTLPITLNVMAETGGPSTRVRLPERASAIASLTINAGPPETITLSTDGREITITSNVTVPFDQVTVNYTAIRPFPQNDEQITLWYDMRAPQTIRDGSLSSPLSLKIIEIGDSVWTLTAGSGSLDEAYPYPTAYVQLGAVKVAAGDSFDGDHELDARAHITVANFDADTGLLKLPVYLPMASGSGSLDLSRPGGAGEVDAESRTYYSLFTSGSYNPNAYGQQLSDYKKHKVVLPVLAQLGSDEPFGQRGSLVLVLLSRWASFDPDNGVWLDSDPLTNTTCASIYRLKCNPLGRRF